MSIVRQAEAVVARAPIVSGDVDALVDAAAIVFGHTFIYICREKVQKRNWGPVVSNFLKHRLGRETRLFSSWREKKININLKQSLAAKLLVRLGNKIVAEEYFIIDLLFI